MTEQILYNGLSFDDLLLIPGESDLMPSDVSTTSKVTRDISLNVPILSAAMDTVTETGMGIRMAQLGGLGVIHRNLSIEEQADCVSRVKRSESGMITDPFTVKPTDTISSALGLMEKYKISGLPVVEGKILVGIITNRDLRFVEDLTRPVSDLMTAGRDKLIILEGEAEGRSGIDFEKAKHLMHKHRIEKLLRVNAKYELTGLVTIKDIEKARLFPHSSKDSNGRLLAAAAVGAGEAHTDRIDALIEQKTDVIVIDTAHGHSKNVLNTLEYAKKKYPETQVIVGNFATEEGAEAAIAKGADAVKIGIGPGSICTTRIISGIGVPQMTAIFNVSRACKKAGIPSIADGGLKYSGDMTKALAGGANALMIGNLLAGAEESPGEVILYQGRRYKQYRGMGSIGAMKKGSKDRYKQGNRADLELIPEGIEGRVSYKGPAGDIIHQMIGGIKAGMGYVGVRTISELQEKGRFVRITNSALKESHVHEVYITEESPNYQV